MTFEEIQELIKLVKRTELTDFKLKDKDFQIKIRTKNFVKGQTQTIVAAAPQVQMATAPAVVAAPVAAPVTVPVPEVAAPAVAASSGKTVVEVKSPIVGTFYRSPGPDKPQFVKVGDSIKAGDIVCIIEAMKLFNEIESDATGTIVKVCVEDASPVEYDQVLFLVEV
jgi:acetyl-CoA carboxylase biotin carboxyl carrier protein